MARLQRLDLTGLNSLSTAGLRQLGSIEHLECVVLHGIDTVDDRVLESLSKLKSIRKLDISSCVSVTSDGVAFIGRMVTLTALDLSGNSRLGQQRAWTHLKTLRHLESLKVKSVVFSEDQMDDFSDFLPVWSKLIELRLGFCQIRDKHCSAFSNLRNLRTLSIHNASSLKAESYSYFSHIIELDLSRSTVPVHALEHLSQLTYLELKNAKLTSSVEARPLVSPKNRIKRQSASAEDPTAMSISPLSLASSSNTGSMFTSVEVFSSGATSPSDPRFMMATSSSAIPSDFSDLTLSPDSASPSSSGHLNYDLNFEPSSPPSPASSQHIFRRRKLGGSHSSSSSITNPFLTSSSPPSSNKTIDDMRTSTSPPGGSRSYESKKSPRASSSSSIDTPTSSRSRRSSANSTLSSPSPSKSKSSPKPIPSSSSSSKRYGSDTVGSVSPQNGYTRSPSRKSETVEVRPLASLHSLPTLRRLSLRVENLTDKDISHVSKCHKLRELDLLWVNNVTSRGLQKLAHLRLIQQLNLTNCKTLTDETLQVILPNMKFLKALSLAHCQLIGDPGLLAIASNSFQLRYLVLFQLQLVTNEGITSLVTLSELEVLEITGCHRIDAPYCEHLLKEFLPGLHLNHNSQPKESSSSAAHCAIS